MRPLLLALCVLSTACTTGAVNTTSQPSPSAIQTARPSQTVDSPAFAPTPPVGSPTPAPTEAPTPPEVSVTIAPNAFAILTTLRPKLAASDDTVVAAARGAVQGYLWNIDQYRSGSSPILPISGRFLEAVSAALKDSATPGVTRTFELVSLTVDRHVQKPWGTHAYAEVTVTIADRVRSGVGDDQWETGKLRLTGDRLRVSDGWDEANGRWFNGFGPLPLEQVRTEIVAPLSMYLHLESWIPGSEPQLWRAAGDESTPFMRARAERAASIDRTKTVAQTFEGVVGTIERFETLEGIWSGIATVRLNGTRIRRDATGATSRAPFETRVRVFMFGGWMPEVVDEEVTPGAWLSGGDLALEKIDVDRA